MVMVSALVDCSCQEVVQYCDLEVLRVTPCLEVAVRGGVPLGGPIVKVAVRETVGRDVIAGFRGRQVARKLRGRGEI